MSRRQILIASTITALSAMLALHVPSAHAAAAVDEVAPTFTAIGADGKPVNLAAFKGKTVVLEWTNHECPYVVKHYSSGNAQALQKEATAKGVVWLQVISSAPGQQGHVDGATAQELNRKRGAAPTATLLDPEGKLGKLYGAQTTPHLYIVDTTGRLAYKGGIDSIASNKVEDVPKAESYVRLALADLAAGRKVAQSSTKPYGCSVKYAAGGA
jgi:peroxiredoxin